MLKLYFKNANTNTSCETFPGSPAVHYDLAASYGTGTTHTVDTSSYSSWTNVLTYQINPGHFLTTSDPYYLSIDLQTVTSSQVRVRIAAKDGSCNIVGLSDYSSTFSSSGTYGFNLNWISLTGTPVHLQVLVEAIRTATHGTRQIILYVEDPDSYISETTGIISAVDAEITYTETSTQAQIAAVDAEITYTTIQAQVAAVDAEVTYSERKAQVAAVDAEVTYSERKAQVAAVDGEITYSEIQAQVAAVDAEVTYSERKAQVAAVDAEVTYSEVKAQVAAVDGEITYSERKAQVAAVDGEITYDTIGVQIAAVDAEITYSERKAQVAAVDAEITYSERKAQFAAVDAEITYTTVVSAQVAAVDAEITYTEIKTQVSAVDAEVTYSERKAQVAAVDAEITYSEVKAQVSAVDAEVTYSERKAQIAAVDGEITYDPIKAQIAAVDAEATYSERKAQVAAVDAEITYSERKAQVAAVDAEITYTTTLSVQISAVDAEITYTTIQTQIAAVDAEVTYEILKSQIAAVDAEVTYSERKAQIAAVDAEVTYSERKAQIAAVDGEITYDPIKAQIAAADAEVTYSERKVQIAAVDAEVTYSERKAQLAAADAEITYTEIKTQIAAADAEITYSETAGEYARISAVDAYITYVEEGPWFDTRAVRKADDGVSATDFPRGIIVQPGGLSAIAGEPRIMVPPSKKPWDGRNPFRLPGRRTPLPLAGIIWYTWDPGDVTDLTALQASPMDKGYGYNTFKEILTARITARGGTPSTEIVEVGDAVWLYGEVIIDLLSMMDVVFIGHWLPGYHAQLIKARSTAPNGTKIILWTDFEDINQGPAWVTEQIQYRNYLADYPLGSVGGYNAWGCTTIDQFESNPWTTDTIGCPHTPKHNSLIWPAAQYTTHGIMIDMYAATDSANYQSNLTKSLIEIYNTSGALQSRYSGGWQVDGFHFDTVMDRPLKGSSSLDFEATWTTERYQQSWTAFFNAWHYWNSAMPNPWASSADSLWGNMDDSSMLTYSTNLARNRYLEWFFIKYAPTAMPKTKQDIHDDLKMFSQTGAYCILGQGSGADIGNIHYWGTTTGAYDPSANGTWQDVANYAYTLGITDRTYALAFRTSGTGNFLMLQDVMRRPS